MLVLTTPCSTSDGAMTIMCSCSSWLSPPMWKVPCVRLLLLPGLKTIDIAEHAISLEEIDFLHLLGVERLETGDVFRIRRL